MKLRLTISLAVMLWCSIVSAQTPAFISDSMAHLFQNSGLDSATVSKMVMTTDGMGDYQHINPNPALKITLVQGPDMMRILNNDTNTYKIVLIWSCWSKYGISEMVNNKYLFNSDKYALYLVSADLNNNRQRDTISRFLTSIGVSEKVYQLNSPIELSDLQNSKTTARFIGVLTGHMQDILPLNVCQAFPYAIIYDKANKVVRTFDGHFSFADLAQFRKKTD